MDTTRLEELLEQLIDKQDELISRIESLEATVEGQLTEANINISSLQIDLSVIRDELSGLGEGSLASRLLTALSDIESAVTLIE